MVNKDKLVLVAMISMLLPGAVTDAFGQSDQSGNKKTAKRSGSPPPRSEQPVDRAIARAQQRRSERRNSR